MKVAGKYGEIVLFKRSTVYLYGFFLTFSSISLMVKRVSISKFVDVLTYSFALYYIEAFPQRIQG